MNVFGHFSYLILWQDFSQKSINAYWPPMRNAPTLTPARPKAKRPRKKKYRLPLNEAKGPWPQSNLTSPPTLLFGPNPILPVRRTPLQTPPLGAFLIPSFCKSTSLSFLYVARQNRGLGVYDHDNVHPYFLIHTYTTFLITKGTHAVILRYPKVVLNKAIGVLPNQDVS